MWKNDIKNEFYVLTCGEVWSPYLAWYRLGSRVKISFCYSEAEVRRVGVDWWSVDYAKLKLLLNLFTLEINSSNLKLVTGVFVHCSEFVIFVFRDEASILLLFFHVFFRIF